MECKVAEERKEELTSKRTSRLPIIVGIVIVLLVSLVGGVYLFGRRGLPVEVEKEKLNVSGVSKEGEFSIGKGGQLPDNFPADFPIYPGSDILSSWSADGNGTQGQAIVWQTADSEEKVSDYFKKELESSGWKISSSFEAEGSRTITFEKAETTGFVGITAGEEGKTAIAVTVGIR